MLRSVHKNSRGGLDPGETDRQSLVDSSSEPLAPGGGEGARHVNRRVANLWPLSEHGAERFRGQFAEGHLLGCLEVLLEEGDRVQKKVRGVAEDGEEELV